MNRTDLNLFVVFEAIYAQGGVTRAADVLNLSQPAVSHALARLRDRLGDPLFVRRGKNLTPTSRAQEMIGPVREALRIFDRTLSTLNVFDPARSRMSFTIGMRPLLESAFLPPLILTIREQAPGVSVSSAPHDRRRLETALASGGMSAAVDVFLPPADGVMRAHLYGARSVVLARRGHPQVDGAITREAYLAADHVIVSSRPKGQGPEDVALARDGGRRRIRVHCQEITTAMRLVSTSDLLLTISETFARRANVWFDHQILRTPFDLAPIDTYLYWHESADSDPANIWLRTMIRAAAMPA